MGGRAERGGYSCGVSSRRALAAVTGLLAVGAFASAAGGLTPRSSAADAANGRGAQALRLLADLVAGRDHAIVAMLDTQLAAVLSPAELTQGLTTYEAQFGRYLGHGTPTVLVLGGETVVRVPLHMSRRPGEFRLAFGRGGRVSGFYLLRTGVPL